MLYTATKVNIQHFVLICKENFFLAYYAKQMYNYSKPQRLPELPHCGTMKGKKYWNTSYKHKENER